MCNKETAAKAAAPRSDLMIFTGRYPCSVSYFYRYAFNSSTLSSFSPRKIQIVAAEMSVCSRLFVDRAAQVKHLDDASRTQVKVLADHLNQLILTQLAGS